MFYKWTKQYKRLKLREEIENKKYSMVEVNGQLITYSQANDDVSKEMYKKLLDKRMADIEERDEMQDKLLKPVEDAEAEYKKELEKIENIANEFLTLEQEILKKQAEGRKIKAKLDTLKNQKEEKESQLKELVLKQTKEHGNFTDEDIVQQYNLNGELEKLQVEIEGLEDKYKRIQGIVAMDQMKISEKRRIAMDKIFLATSKYNHKMQTLGEDYRLPTNVEYRQDIFNRMLNIKTEEKRKRIEEKKQKAAENKAKKQEEKEAKRQEIENNREKELKAAKQQEEERKKSPYEKKVDQINAKYDNQQTELYEKPKKDSWFKRLKNWFKNKFRKQKQLPEGQELPENEKEDKKDLKGTESVDKELPVHNEEKTESFVPKVNVEPVKPAGFKVITYYDENGNRLAQKMEDMEGNKMGGKEPGDD